VRVREVPVTIAEIGPQGYRGERNYSIHRVGRTEPTRGPT
jgi:hypothetical protein